MYKKIPYKEKVKTYQIYVTTIDVYTIKATSIEEARRKAKQLNFDDNVDIIKQIPRLNTIRLIR